MLAFTIVIAMFAKKKFNQEAHILFFEILNDDIL
jgi:hypothetical protein